MLNIERRQKYSEQGHTISKNPNLIDIKFDIKTLDLMSIYALSQNKSIRRGHLVSMRNLFSMLDLDVYNNDMERLKRIKFINKVLEAKLLEGLEDPYMVIKYANGGILEADIIDADSVCNETLNNREIEWIHTTISDTLKYAFIYRDIDKLGNLYTRFKSEDFASKGAIVRELETLLDQFKANFRHSTVDKSNEVIFSLQGGYFEDTVREFHAQLTNPSARLQCGMQGLNEMFGGGVENGRCYMFLGPSAGFKSGILLTLAYQIKKYNKTYNLKDPSKRPAVVILTMENTVKESMERLFNMSTVSDNIRNYNADQVIDLLKTQGELYLSDESPIDIIIKYKPNGSVDTGYLYTLVEELEDEGIETICFIQDYVRRIKSVYKQADVRLELGEIINEFKVFASIKDIPFITAGQLNRDASKVIETSNVAKKSDVIRQLGRSNTGESMLMIDNIDWASIINIEYDSAGNKYIGFQNIKSRYTQVIRPVIFQPFISNKGIKLVEDLYNLVPVFKETLKDGIPDLQNFNGGPKTSNGLQRRNMDDIIAEKSKNHEDGEETGSIFDISKYRNSTSIGFENGTPQVVIPVTPFQFI